MDVINLLFYVFTLVFKDVLFESCRRDYVSLILFSVTMTWNELRYDIFLISYD